MNPRWMAIPAVVLTAASKCYLGCRHRSATTSPAAVVPAATAPAPAPHPLHLARANPTAPIEARLLGTPVRAVRTWTKALAPNKHGGWNFITQAYEPKSSSPSEWVVVDLDTGAFPTNEGPSRIYASHVYDIDNENLAP